MSDHDSNGEVLVDGLAGMFADPNITPTTKWSELANSRPPKLSKAAKRAAKNDERRAFEEVNVLITGFALFDDLRESNPSWSIAKSLPPMLPINAAHPSRIRIIVYPEAIPVSYSEVNKLTEAKYGVSCPIHLVLHLGVAEKRDYYSIERSAHRDGYTTKGIDLKVPKPVDQPKYWKEQRPVLESSAALPDVSARWKSVLPDYDLRISNDAGHYMCEYQLYASLAFWSKALSEKKPWQERTMVSFLHVPPGTDDLSIQKGTEITIELIYALIDSRRFRNGDYNGDDGEPISD